MKTTQLTLNCYGAPFGSQGFQSKGIDAICAYMRDAGVDCPLLNHLLPEIAWDRDEEHMLHTCDYASYIKEEISKKEFIEKNLKKTVLTQWGSWFDAWAARAPNFAIHKLLKLYMAIMFGWKINRFGSGSAVLPEPMEAGEKPLSMAAQAKSQEQALRAETNGILHAALQVELDATIKRKAQIFYTLGVGIRSR